MLGIHIGNSNGHVFKEVEGLNVKLDPNKICVTKQMKAAKQAVKFGRVATPLMGFFGMTHGLIGMPIFAGAVWEGCRTLTAEQTVKNLKKTTNYNQIVDRAKDIAKARRSNQIAAAKESISNISNKVSSFFK